MKVLDTFAGAGGFSFGFDQAGCEIVGAIEVDKWAAETFAYNHPDSIIIQKSITDLKDDEIYDVFSKKLPNIILGGPPCQGFSICKKEAGDPKDPRNSLFEEFIRVGKILTPDFMVMENVPNLVKAKTESGKLVLSIIKSEMEKCGFHVYSRVLEATDFGVPQIRKRLFVIASKRPLKRPFPAATHTTSSQASLLDAGLESTPTLWDAISDLPEIKAREGKEVMEYTHDAMTTLQRLLREGAESVFNHVSMKHSARIVERFKLMSCGDNISNLPKEMWPQQRNGNGTISEKVYSQNSRRMFPHKPCHTIPASFYANFVHPFSHRNFTAREGARIQTFPDWYRFMGKPTVVSQKLLSREGREAEKHLCQYNQIGNAVPPLLAQAVARNLLNQV